jgi:predicted small secreted protein
MKRNLITALLGVAVASPLALTGCNTVAGFGEDISATGRAVENVAVYNAPPPRTYYRDRYYYGDRYWVDRNGYRHYY